MTTQEMIFDYLKVQGLVPEYDEDKDIRFKYQMRNFVVSNYNFVSLIRFSRNLFHGFPLC